MLLSLKNKPLITIISFTYFAVGFGKEQAT
jgi:hypothetical protein